MNITDDERREMLSVFDFFLRDFPSFWSSDQRIKTLEILSRIRRLIEDDRKGPTITRDGIIFCRYCGTAISHEEGTDTASGGKEK